MADTRFSDADLQGVRRTSSTISWRQARSDYDQLQRSLSYEDDNRTEDTAPTFKMMEDGSDTMSREETAQLAARQQKFIVSLENALLRIKNKTYGVCRVTGKLIAKRSACALFPHATMSIEAKNQQDKALSADHRPARVASISPRRCCCWIRLSRSWSSSPLPLAGEVDLDSWRL